MRELPIIFSGEMVRAILDGRKTQTRRVVKGEALEWLQPGMFTRGFVALPENKMCPYGQPGDLLWVREAFGIEEERYIQPEMHSYGGRFEEEVFYKADDPSLPGMKWKPSIHMPKRAARLWLEVTGIRVERVQEISEEDAVAEGIYKNIENPDGYGWRYGESCNTARAAFKKLWNSINGKKPGCSWEDNPWVWVVEFKTARRKEG